jgi:hypothetical protein
LIVFTAETQRAQRKDVLLSAERAESKTHIAMKNGAGAYVTDTNRLSSMIIGSVIEVHKAQLMTYLKLANIHLGLLLNFNVSKIRDGIVRVVNKCRK